MAAFCKVAELGEVAEGRAEGREGQTRPEVMEAWIGVGGGLGTRERTQVERFCMRLSGLPTLVPSPLSAAALTLSRPTFLTLEDTSAWRVPPNPSGATHSHCPV